MSVSFIGITAASQLSDEQRTEILAEFRRVRGSPFKVSNNLIVPVSVVWAVIDDNPDVLSARIERYDGLGRPDLRPFIVGKRRAGSSWDNTDASIATARLNYELGTHDMMTHRDGTNEFLVSKPQKRITPRPEYFKPEL